MDYQHYQQLTLIETEKGRTFIVTGDSMIEELSQQLVTELAQRLATGDTETAVSVLQQVNGILDQLEGIKGQCLIKAEWNSQLRESPTHRDAVEQFNRAKKRLQKLQAEFLAL